MTLMDQTQGSEMERLWGLLSELSAQLSHNRQQTEELHRRADELKAQAIHTQTGFTLRRFNLDVSKEEFDSELERLNVSLVMENQALQQENRQLSSLLKDYESTLEAVMGKFRAHAHATQQHHLELIRHYESLLLSMPVTLPPPESDPEAAPAIDPLHLQLSLSHLGSLIRKALRSLQGEDPEDSTSPLLHAVNTSPLDALRDAVDHGLDGSAGGSSFSSSSSASSDAGTSDYGDGAPDLDRLLASHHPNTFRSLSQLHDESEGGYVGRTASTNPHYIPTTSTSSLVASPPRPGQPVRARDEAASRGLGPVDDALQREIELEALRRENDELKKMLGIADDADGPDEDGEPLVQPPPPPPPTGTVDESLRI
ncbi:hypothetical protein JCM5296_004122 [Sporobolomyces johnsonii]